ncbi:MAG TPA: hypothetical protein ENN19_13365 [Chloroflexi bacterium]|nr:hypothetical protein [Chloroflexota bacterium]
MTERGNQQPLERRMRTLLDELDYDFSQFTMKGFVDWLEEWRGREIFFIPYHFQDPRVSGAWWADQTRDYVFYEKQDTPPVLQSHAQLHEIAHMLCGHPIKLIDTDDVRFLLTPTNEHTSTHGSLSLRCTPHDPHDEHEMEAEMLASLIQERVLSHARLQELLKTVSSDERVATYLRNLKAQ